MRRKGIGQVVGIAVVAIGATIVTLAGDIRPVLGLDLQGGVSVVLQPVKAGKKATKVSQEALEQTQAIIETRVNAIGVAEPEIAIQGDTIVVQLPGVENQKRVLALVGKTAELRFRPVLETPAAAPPKNAKSTIAKLRKQLAIPDGVTATQTVAPPSRICCTRSAISARPATCAPTTPRTSTRSARPATTACARP